MDASQKEYDRFGPWVTEVSGEDPVPPVFAPYVPAHEHAVYMLKVPRKIERRSASPGMDLYDFLVGAFEDGILILRREGSTVHSERCPYSEIQIVHFMEDLLDGRLRMVVSGRPVELRFSSVSSNVMAKLLRLIRERYAKEAKHATEAMMSTEPRPGLSFYFQGRLSEYAANLPDFRLCATQAEVSIAHTEAAGLRRLFYRLFGRRLTESLHYSDGRELVIVHHGRRFRYLRRPLYAQHTTYIPVSRITAVRWEDDPGNAEVVNLTVWTKEAEFTIGFAKGNPGISGYAAFLSRALEAGSEA